MLLRLSGLPFVVLAGMLAGLPTGAAALQDASSAPLDPAVAAATFDSVWNRVDATYYDRDFGGLDWTGVGREYRPQALAAEHQPGLRSVIAEMLAHLGDSHFAVIPASSATALAAGESGTARELGEPGLDVRWIDDALVVTSVRAGAPADRAGVRVGWIVQGVDGTTVADLAVDISANRRSGTEAGELSVWLPLAVRGLLRGPVGSTASISLLDGERHPVELDLLRAQLPGELVRFGNLPPLRLEVEHRSLAAAEGRRVGLLRFNAWMPAVVPGIAAGIDALREADAIIVDLRGNPGGLGALVMGVGGHFLDEPLSLGRMTTRDASLEFVVNPQLVAPDGRRVRPFGGPLLILTDPLTASTSEIFAGGLQAAGRAVVVGERTAGQALPALVVPLPNGDLFMHAVGDFVTPDGRRIEGRGVRPDVPVLPDRGALLRGEDPTLAEAMRWINAR